MRIADSREGESRMDIVGVYDDRPCHCGHEAEAHEHYRPGTDCGFADCDCRYYQSMRHKRIIDAETGDLT
jgi:hypothetical protein